MKKIISLYSLLLLACSMTLAHAATSVASFDPVTGTLSVTGSCSGRYVLIVIKNAASGTIWGSSNPPCVNGAYAYSIAVPDSARTGGTFSVAATDNGVSASAVTAPQAVVFSQASGMDQTATSTINSASITLDTSTLAAGQDDASVLDGILQGFFGIATDAMNAIESSVVAAMQLFAKMFTILPGGSISVPTGPNEMAGQGMLPADATSVFVSNTAVSSSSDIIITPTAPTQVPLSVTQITAGSGFSVGTAGAQAAGIPFTWIIVNTYADATSSTPAPPAQEIQQAQQTQQAPAAQSLIAVPQMTPSTEVSAPADSSTQAEDVSPDATSTTASTTTVTVATTTTTTTIIATTTTTTVATTSDDTIDATTSPAIAPDPIPDDASATDPDVIPPASTTAQ